MFQITIKDETNRYELTELAKMFVPAEELSINIAEYEYGSGNSEGSIVIPGSDEMDRNAQKRILYDFLSDKTGIRPEWGTLTGVRPLKLFGRVVKSVGSEHAAVEYLKKEYLISYEKAMLLKRAWQTQQNAGYSKDPGAIGLYIGIPFCPTRCLYCSFSSNKYSREASDRYLQALKKEMDAVGRLMRKKSLFAESIYIGGGTPTSLEEDQFDTFVSWVSDIFAGADTGEWTVECGRPDTITAAKLRSLKAAGAGRISINPQSMQQKTLDIIGRHHTPEQITDAFNIARECGIEIINADLIAGLPDETPEDFEDTLKKILELSPENITVHTLAVKRGSRLIDTDKDYSYRQGDIVRKMLMIAEERLSVSGYSPYYLYRQKHMAGNFENVGWCRPGTASIYNIRIMEEDQSIIALGAGGISKVYFPEEDRLERVPNVSNYEIYIERIDEMIKRKEEGL